MRRCFACALALIILLLASCGGSKSGETGTLTAGPGETGPLFMLEGDAAGALSFPATLPSGDSFNATRVLAQSTNMKLGSAYESSSPNVSAASGQASFVPAGDLAWAIYRFEGAPQDSIGELSVALSGLESGAEAWVGIGDYSAQHWDWLGSTTAVSAQFPVSGAPGQHSSPGGGVYVAVLSGANLAFDVDSVSLLYLNRQSVSGTVTDEEGQPLQGILITTNLDDPQETLTDAEGNYTLHAVPPGQWSVMVAAHGYHFPEALQVVDVNDSAVSGVDFWGKQDFTPLRLADANEPNNVIFNATVISGSVVEEASLSIYNDPKDYYSFTVPDFGYYYLLFEGESSLLFPNIQILSAEQRTYAYSSGVAYGANLVGTYLPAPGEYFVEVRCEGGGGTYSLSSGEGPLTSISGQIYDEDDENFEGEEYEEPYLTLLKVEFADYSMYLYQGDSGSFSHEHVPALPAVISVEKPFHSFSPESYAHDFSAGPLEDLDFDIETTPPADEHEPNGSLEEAFEITLPLSEPLQSVKSPHLPDDDDYDYFKFSTTGGRHLQIRLELEDSLQDTFGPIDVYLLNDLDEYVDGHNNGGHHGVEYRSQDPLAAGTYFIQVRLSGTGVERYSFTAREFDAESLAFQAMMNGEPLNSVEVLWYIAGLDFYKEEYLGNDGLSEVSYPFIEGERVFFCYRRYGSTVDASPGYVVIGSGETIVDPLIESSGDSFEPNDSMETAKPVDYPVDLNATLSSENDLYDNYTFSTSSSEIKVTITSANPAAEYRVSIRPAESFSTISSDFITGSGSCFLRTDLSGAYRLEITPHSQYETGYSLQVEDAVAYSISGTVDHGKPTEFYFGMIVRNLTTGDTVTPGNSGVYNLGYFEPGEYSVVCRLANHTVVPAGQQNVTVVNADIVLDFTATYAYTDEHEPNDDDDTAFEISLPADFSANLDYININIAEEDDREDWYKFTAPADGIVFIQLDPAWRPYEAARMELMESTWSNGISWAKENTANGNLNLRAPVKAGALYLINISGSADVVYGLTASMLPE